MDWHSRADDALSQLRMHSDSPVYQDLLTWLQCLYEREKESMAQCQDPIPLPEHWMKIRGLKMMRDMLE